MALGRARFLLAALVFALIGGVYFARSEPRLSGAPKAPPSAALGSAPQSTRSTEQRLELTAPAVRQVVRFHVRCEEPVCKDVSICFRSPKSEAIECSIHPYVKSFELEQLRGEGEVCISSGGRVPGCFSIQKDLLDYHVVLVASDNSIAGIALDIAGGPVEGALVELSSGGFVTTEAGGRFSISTGQLPVEIRVSAPGYNTFSQSVRESTGVLTVTLSPSTFLSGRVVDDSTGFGVPGATVIAQHAVLAGQASSTTGADGSFTVQGLGMGLQFMHAEGADFASAPMEVDVPLTGLQGLTLRVTRTRTLTVVAAVEGVPCRGGARALGSRGSRMEFAGGVTSIPGLLDGTYFVEVECEGALPERRQVEVSADERVEFGLRPAAVAQLEVTGVGGQPEAEIEVSCQADSEIPICHGHTDEQGHYQCTHVPGLSLFCAAYSDGRRVSEPVHLPSNFRGMASLRLAATGTLQLVPGLERDPSFAAQTFWLSTTSGDEFLPSSSSDTEVFFSHLRPGTYIVHSTGLHDVPVTVGDSLATFEVPTAVGNRVEGTVVDEEGNPVADAVVRVRADAPALSSWGRGARILLADERGEFIAEDVVGHSFYVEASRGLATGALGAVRPRSPVVVQVGLDSGGSSEIRH